ncbi:alpha/beta fold hydrolase [Sphingomonas sp.]|uniref:alpha/beta fold hydrolase n=1 Tax=Sphingomonas sp. TaxID=28214 RepID=UPI003B3AB766
MVQDYRIGQEVTGKRASRHHVHAQGSGKDTLIFSHGFGTDQSAWSAVAPHFAERARCILFDLPGAGPLLPEDFDARLYGSIAGYADDLLNLLDELEIEKCRYIGHSVSGMIGLLAAIEAPHRFDQLLLLNASARYLNDTSYVGGFEKAALEHLLGEMARNYHGWVAGFTPQAIPSGRPEAVSEFAASLLAMRPEVSVQISRMIFQTDIRTLLPHVHVPTVLLQSRDDIAVPPEASRWMAQQIEDAELVWIDAQGHLPHLSAPDAIIEALDERLH